MPRRRSFELPWAAPSWQSGQTSRQAQSIEHQQPPCLIFLLGQIRGIQTAAAVTLQLHMQQVQLQGACCVAWPSCFAADLDHVMQLAQGRSWGAVSWAASSAAVGYRMAGTVLLPCNLCCSQPEG